MRRLIRRYWKLGLLPSGLLLAWTLVGANAATPAADAAQAGDIPTIRTLIQQKADLNRAQADGMTALHWSASHNDVAMTQVLLRAGANPNTETRLGAITPSVRRLEERERRNCRGVVKSGGEGERC